jgi:hypothetical protein
MARLFCRRLADVILDPVLNPIKERDAPGLLRLAFWQQENPALSQADNCPAIS